MEKETIENPFCGCGGPARNGHAGPHRVGDSGCFREMVLRAPRMLADPGDFGVEWVLSDGSIVTGFSLMQQRGYARHECGRWSKQLGGSCNSIREDLSEWDPPPGVRIIPPEDPISIVEDLNLESYDALGDDFTPFEVSSNGYETAVTFCGYPIWGTEDQGDRGYDEDANRYEPLEAYLRRAALRMLRDLNNLYRQWEKRE